MLVSSNATRAIVTTLAPNARLSRPETISQIWPRRDQTPPMSASDCGGGGDGWPLGMERYFTTLK